MILKMFFKVILKAAHGFKLSPSSPVSNSVHTRRAIWPRKKSTQPFGKWPPADPTLKPLHQSQVVLEDAVDYLDL